MVAVITGDIVNSQQFSTEHWLPDLKALFARWGNSPFDWEIYRGDEFQLRCKAVDAFRRALSIKSLLKKTEALDVRLSIGLGQEEYVSMHVAESSGSAYVLSGRQLDEIKVRTCNLAFASDDENLSADFNVLFKWASLEFDNWTPASAEIIHELLNRPEATQESLAKLFGISQSSVSQRMRRANYDLIMETDRYYRRKISQAVS